MAFRQREVPLSIILAHGREALDLLTILKEERQELISANITQ